MNIRQFSQAFLGQIRSVSGLTDIGSDGSKYLGIRHPLLWSTFTTCLTPQMYSILLAAQSRRKRWIETDGIMNFYLSQNGQKLGPYSVEQIQIFLKQGLVTTTDHVWAEGWSSWIPVGNVLGLGFDRKIKSLQIQPRMKRLRLWRWHAVDRQK